MAEHNVRMKVTSLSNTVGMKTTEVPTSGTPGSYNTLSDKPKLNNITIQGSRTIEYYSGIDSENFVTLAEIDQIFNGL